MKRSRVIQREAVCLQADAIEVTQANDKRNLGRIFETLNPAEQQSLLAFAEFLQSRNRPETPEPEQLTTPLPIPRPSQETVVSAIKRLTKTYPMLDIARLLNEVSVLMSQHVLQGQAENQVVDELEQLFLRHYQNKDQP